MKSVLCASIVEELERRFPGRVFLSLKDLCAFFECDEKTIYNWNQRSNRPPQIKVGRSLKYPKNAIAEWIATEL